MPDQLVEHVDNEDVQDMFNIDSIITDPGFRPHIN